MTTSHPADPDRFLARYLDRVAHPEIPGAPDLGQLRAWYLKMEGADAVLDWLRRTKEARVEAELP